MQGIGGKQKIHATSHNFLLGGYFKEKKNKEKEAE